MNGRKFSFVRIFMPSIFSYVRVVAFGLCFVQYLDPGCYEHYIKYWITVAKIHFSGKHFCQPKPPNYFKFVSPYLFDLSLKKVNMEMAWKYLGTLWLRNFHQNSIC